MNVVDLRAPMVGSVKEISCAVGDEVREGDEVVILESMKMEIPVTAECSGRVTEILVTAPAPVAEGDVLLRIAAA